MINILIIDDEAGGEYTKEYLDLLFSDKAKTIFARGIISGIKYLKEDTFDIVITDLLMPMEGLPQSIIEKYDFLSAGFYIVDFVLNKMESKTHILIFSARRQPEKYKETLSKKNIHYIRKGFGFDNIGNKINQIIDELK